MAIMSFYIIHRVGQNHIYTVYIRCFWLGNHQTYGVYIRIYTFLANTNHTITWYSNIVFNVINVSENFITHP